MTQASNQLRINYFKILALKPKFGICKTDLKKNYYAIQKHVHPDLIYNFTKENVTKETQDKYKDHSILVNEAYNHLKDEYLRTNHLIDLYSYIKQTELHLDKMFIMEHVELREKYEDSENEEIKNKIMNEIIDKEKNCFIEIRNKIDIYNLNVEPYKVEWSNVILLSKQISFYKNFRNYTV